MTTGTNAEVLTKAFCAAIHFVRYMSAACEVTPLLTARVGVLAVAGVGAPVAVARVVLQPQRGAGVQLLPDLGAFSRRNPPVDCEVADHRVEEGVVDAPEHAPVGALRV